MSNTVYYQWGKSTQGPLLIMKYGGSNDGWDGYTRKFMGYSLREAFRKFKENVGIKRAKLVKVDWLFFGIY